MASSPKFSDEMEMEYEHEQITSSNISGAQGNEKSVSASPPYSIQSLNSASPGVTVSIEPDVDTPEA